MLALLIIDIVEHKSAEPSAEPDHTADSGGKDPFFCQVKFQLFQFPACIATQQVMPAQCSMAVRINSDDRTMPKIPQGTRLNQDKVCWALKL